MKVLLDHNLPHKLRLELAILSTDEFITTSFVGWQALRNGELLAAAESAGFDVFVTGDRSMAFEQKVVGRVLAIVALTTNNWPILRERVTEIHSAVLGIRQGEFLEFDCGEFSRRGRESESK